MFMLIFLALLFSVLLASNASVLSNNTSDIDPTTTIKRFSFAARATPNVNKGSSDNHTLQDEANMQYIATVSVGDHDFLLLVDTGSSDLWISSPAKLKFNSTTNTDVNLTYGIGCVYGNIAYAPVSFGGYRVDNQAFLIASKTCSDNADAEGILGLGLNGLAVLERTTKNTSARSVVANLFVQNASIPHLIGLALERSDEGDQTAGGFLTVGEYDPQFSNITHAPKNPVTPASGSRWTIAMDTMTINGKHLELESSVKGAQKGQAIALIDSGTSLAYIPNDAVEAIYSQFNGSVHVQTSNQDAWFLPCLEQANLSFTFSNTPYPINPMELSFPMRVAYNNDQYTVCINAFRPTLKGTEHELDYLLGDIFMRNVYTVFNFGNVSAPNGRENTSADAQGASIQFLSRTNRDQVYVNFERFRQDVLKGYPPLFDLSKLRTDGTVDGGGVLEPPAEE